MTFVKEAALEWLSLVESSGLYLAPKVLEAAFPQSLDAVDTAKRQRLRSAWDEWREIVESNDPHKNELHLEWVRLVLTELLEYRDTLLRLIEASDEEWTHTSYDTGAITRPTWLLRAGQDTPKLAVFMYPPNRSFERAGKGAASLTEQVTAWCRAKGIRNALLTDGERWMLLDAPEGAVSGSVTWYARLWWLEPVTLRAFYSLLRARNLFGPAEKTFPQLVEDSQEYRNEVTTTLGEQVERAVEVLVRSLDRANRDKKGKLLEGVSERELYEAGLTVMMRLVFILSAEERGLLLLGDPVWDANYAISTLRSQLEEIDDRDGHGVLALRFDAWTRLLAVFRALYGGIAHESLRLPALGGSLFDPDRFPFLEGRAVGTSWRDTEAEPLPIDNRTVLLLLNALQKLAKRDGAQTLSYRALDVEQIGHVYEGLLERTVSRVDDVTLGLKGAGKTKTPDIRLSELESARFDGTERLTEVLKEKAGLSDSAIRRALTTEPAPELHRALAQACDGDGDLVQAILPFANLLRADPWDEPVVYRKDAFAVTSGSDRKETGTHYTPKALTERIVGTTLEPVTYVGPAEGLPREQWKLKSAAQLLDLKICDPAMGSGAFLVQVCRWLSEKVVQAWAQAEEQGGYITAEGNVVTQLAGHEPMPADPEERLTLARRLVAERCLYGVDINPVAVELAKLSIWLVTLAKNLPFGFLDHNLRHGDSLLGIRDLDQLTSLSMNPKSGDNQPLFALNIRQAVDQALDLRTKLRAIPIRDIEDVKQMAKLDEQARRVLQRPELAADALIGEAMRHAGRPNDLSVALRVASTEIGQMMNGDPDGEKAVEKRAKESLAVDLPYGKNLRKPMHWPLEFPEVFLRENGGFDAFVGNPPFLGGQKITGVMGTRYRNFLVEYVANGSKGSADLVAYFFLNLYYLLHINGNLGLLAVNTIAEGGTREVGLQQILDQSAFIFEAHPNEAWPGKAAVSTSRVHLSKGKWDGDRILSGQIVDEISSFLSVEADFDPKKLLSNRGESFQGSIVLGLGFVVQKEVAEDWVKKESNNSMVLYPYLNGEDLNSNPDQSASRWVINFWDWSEEKAKQYSLPFQHAVENVKPERQRKNENGEFALRKPLPERWWQYAEKRPGLYHAIGRGRYFEQHPKEWFGDSETNSVIVCSLVSKHLAYSLVPAEQVFAHRLAVFSSDRFDYFALLSSTANEIWARKNSSSLETRMNYSPSDAYETFPKPLNLLESLKDLGKDFSNLRKKIMIDRDLGVTKLYNAVHSPSENSADIENLRSLQAAIDNAVLKSYGWEDFPLEHGFYEVSYLPENDRTRYTVGEKARLEILRRLAKLNQERYEAEQAAQQLPSKTKSKGTRAPKAASAKAAAPLFDALSAAVTPEQAKRAVLDILGASNRWFGKAEILRESGISEADWKLVIDELVTSGTVEKQGEKRGTVYMLKR